MDFHKVFVYNLIMKKQTKKPLKLPDSNTMTKEEVVSFFVYEHQLKNQQIEVKDQQIE